MSACGGSSQKASITTPLDLPKASDNPSQTTSVSILFGTLTAKIKGYVGLSVDQYGNSYFIEPEQSIVLKMTADGVITRVAGLPNVSGTLDGSVGVATFRFEANSRIAVDYQGNVYVSNWADLRKIGIDGTVKTLSFPQIQRIDDFAIDSANNLYVADSSRCAVWQVSALGNLATFVGNPGECGDQDGVGNNARLGRLTAIVVDKYDQIYVIDESRLKKISQQRDVTSIYGIFGRQVVDSINPLMTFADARSLAVDVDNNIYVASGVDSIFKVSPSRIVTVVRGAEIKLSDGYNTYPRTIAVSPSGNVLVNERFAISQYRLDGSALSTSGRIEMDGMPGNFTLGSFSIDKAGTFWVPDYWYTSVRSISPNGIVSTKYGDMNIQGTFNQQQQPVYFRAPIKLVMDKDQNLYVLDNPLLESIRKISPSGTISTIDTGIFMHDMAIDSLGNLFVVEHTVICGKESFPCAETRIRKVTPAGVVTSLPGSEGYHTGITVDKDGNIYTASKRHVISKYDTKGKMSVVAGLLDNPGSQNGDGVKARFSRPGNLTTDSKANVYIVDFDNNAIRKLTPSGHVSTIIDKETLAKSFPDTTLPKIGQIYVDSDDTFYLGLNGLAIAKVKL
ncbi:hypothetical protein H8K35_14815 [Undibacterium sp. LX40W]|uniref:SMP-30/Gluconolactonase/LRE-like region domain-containing protein n=1 Tax=Undibacterium nitidum TaxID=2762298 RepID=A0A923KTW4_9BURK|nr:MULTISPECIES: hypothetical protein [Undibacterium]MBC3882661.1 hypothetical protein [Undibacterium nitidum]MBC3892942.1 hypothetical protein [Undibacterium sp. LX40W]